jgi:predicted amidohydrolase
MRLDLRTFDVGHECNAPADFAAKVVELTRASWNDGAELVVFPEFTWMGLERFVDPTRPLMAVADLFWAKLWPWLQGELSVPDKAVVLGTVPFIDADGSVRNRAPVLAGGSFIYQDKIHLTPWEDAFRGGGPVRLWRFRGLAIAVIICLDIEIPEISAALRSSQVDLVLVPSATESQLGVERVGRCADARSVELGCQVGLCHLVGRMASQWVDENVGRMAFFSPSQSPFLGTGRQQLSAIFENGFHCLSVEIDMDSIRRSRSIRMETNPANIQPARIVVEEAVSNPDLHDTPAPEMQTP